MMTTTVELYRQALEKITKTIEARREGYFSDFHEQAAKGDGWFTQHEQGVLDAYDEVQMLLDSVNYELDQMLDAQSDFAGAVMQNG
jgi:hypothetical protein